VKQATSREEELITQCILSVHLPTDVYLSIYLANPFTDNQDLNVKNKTFSSQLGTRDLGAIGLSDCVEGSWGD
jgi:hypothetical protein